MPELPEVEQFRQVLLPLVSNTEVLYVTSPKDNPPRVWISSGDVGKISGKVICTEVRRKGKQLCLVLKELCALDTAEDDGDTAATDGAQHYLFLHMGMTGRISSPGVKMGWGHEGNIIASEEEAENSEENFPPNYTYMTLQTGSYKAAFADPRKFGKAELVSDASQLDELAPDALDCSDQDMEDTVLPSLMEKTLGIKALLLDQKRACCGVGNWVADEVLYQTETHPDQQYLTREEAHALVLKLKEILACAVECLKAHRPYPDDWLFPYRWTKKKAGSDSQGRSITFLKSGGRTSAIIAPIQVLKGRARVSKAQKWRKEPITDATDTEPDMPTSTETPQGTSPKKPKRSRQSPRRPVITRTANSPVREEISDQGEKTEIEALKTSKYFAEGTRSLNKRKAQNSRHDSGKEGALHEGTETNAIEQDTAAKTGKAVPERQRGAPAHYAKSGTANTRKKQKRKTDLQRDTRRPFDSEKS